MSNEEDDLDLTLLKPTRLKGRKNSKTKSPKDYDDQFEYRRVRKYRHHKWEPSVDDDSELG